MSGGSKLRVLMTADTVGGVWTYALDLAAGLASYGVETLLAVMGPEPSPDQHAAAIQVPGLRLVLMEQPLEWLAGSAAEVMASGDALARLARQAEVDLVHLNAPGPAAGAAFPVPVLVVCHSCLLTWWQVVRGGDVPADFRWRAELTARGYGAADQLIAPSAAFAEATQSAYALPVTPEVVPNGRRVASSCWEVAERPVAFTAGRLWDEGKNAAMLDRAAAWLPFPVFAAGPVAGPNGAQVRLRNLRLLGQMPATDVTAWLAARPIFASAARYEPFGLTVLEAAQAGCALVLADMPVFRELWDGVAVFVPACDPPGFAHAMRSLAENGERRAALGVAAQERAREYSLEAQTEAMLAAYRRLLAGVGSQTGRDVAA